MIGVDWGTSSLRAYRLAADGAVLERREAARGILHVEPGGFPDALRDAVGDWIAAGERRVLLSGMVGSRQGWREAPYVPCPAGMAELAAGLVPVPFEGAEVLLTPGVSAADASGVPEVMRGEETQVLGASAPAALVCLPGSHSKWARVADGRILGYATYLTGEAFAALRGHTILGRLMRDGNPDPAAFGRGVARAGEPGGLLHHLFGVRTLGLVGQLADEDAASYLSGLLIGHEVRAALPPGGAVHLMGAAPLGALYPTASELCSGRPPLAYGEAAARGLAALGEHAAWT